MKQNVDSVLETAWLYLSIVFGIVSDTEYVPSFQCCEGVASLSSSAGMNYL